MKQALCVFCGVFFSPPNVPDDYTPPIVGGCPAVQCTIEAQAAVIMREKLEIADKALHYLPQVQWD